MPLSGQFASQGSSAPGRGKMSRANAFSLTNFVTTPSLRECNRIQEHLMVRARFFLPAVALVATTLEGQEPRTVAANEPMVSGVVRDAGGTPVAQVEVGVIRGERLQQFVVTAADGKFLLTGVGSGMVPLRVRRIGYAMQFFDVDTRVPSSRSLDIVLSTVANELEEVLISGNDLS